MATPRVGTLPQADRAAIFDAARKLKLNPYELGGFLSLESGTNMDPNIRGGAGGNYYGMIQFGPDEEISRSISYGSIHPCRTNA